MDLLIKVDSQISESSQMFILLCIWYIEGNLTNNSNLKLSKEVLEELQ